MCKPVFSAETNLINKYQTIIYERTASLKNYRFAIDKANFYDDRDYNEFIKYVVDSLNEALNNKSIHI